MTQEERDEKDFEEWWNQPHWTEVNFSTPIGWAKLAWLASRRLLREKEGKDG